MTVPDIVQRSRAQAQRSEETAALLAKAHAATCEAERRRLLGEVIELNMGLADAIANRYAGRGVSTEDLRQVSYAALTQAAHRFDPAQGTEFVSYAVPSVRGEVRKYFRDHAWMVRPTRRIQELQAEVMAAGDALWHALGRSPRPSEIAEHLGEPVETVIEALTADGCFTPTSLDQPVAAATGLAGTLGTLLGAEDPGQGAAEARVVLKPVLGSLSERDRHILYLRFYAGWTQREIAEDIGVTQMQISRLLTRILRDLRASIGRLDPGHATEQQPSDATAHLAEPEPHTATASTPSPSSSQTTPTRTSRAHATSTIG